MADTFRALCAELVRAWDVTSDFDYNDFGNSVKSIVNRARAALANEPAVPTPPADGEVAELVAALQSMATDADRRCRFSNAERLSRAAELLERQALVPVPVSEQWPEFSDCDDADRVWCWSWAIGTWRLSRINQSIHTHWLPAHALPLPEVGE